MPPKTFSNLSYKYCVVPKCKNTTIRAPGKMFFSIPSGKQIRRDWCSAMGRNRSLGANTRFYCCEDHFDIENDMENYMKWKLYGVSKLVLRKGVLPHKFACQNYMTVRDTQTPHLNNTIQVKEEIAEHDSSTLSCNSACQNYMTIRDTQTPHLNNTIQIKEEIAEHDSSTLSCNSDTLSCDSETEARLKEIYDVQVKKEIVHEHLPDEHTEDVDPLAIEVPNTEPSTKPYIVNIVYVADVTKKKAIIKL